MTEWTPVTRYTRCKRYSGATLKCPHCGHLRTVYHLSWSALSCQKCKKSHLKINWLIEKGKHSKL